MAAETKLYAIRNARGLYNKTGPLGGWVKELNRATFYSKAQYARHGRTRLRELAGPRSKLEVVEVVVSAPRVLADAPKRPPKRVKPEQPSEPAQ